ncbi:hypothetical protein [Shewanella inventionis]|nr:hypothetical protein [Shewanella inventionis]
MATRTNEEWAASIQQQSASGLTIIAFRRLYKVSIYQLIPFRITK